MFAALPDPSRHHRRASAILLVAAVHALLLLALWTLAPPTRPPEPSRKAITVTLLPEASPAPAAPAQNTAQPAAPRSAPVEQKRPVPPQPIAKPAVPPGWSINLMPGMETFDLAQLPRAAAPEQGVAGSGRSAAADAGGVPGRETLFPAQWQRKPTRAELAAYLPQGQRQSGVGIIACRTVENYRVEDCEEVGQSPAGSGLAGAVRQAAWQFRVLPPRVGGRALVGAWVQIRIEYREGVPD